MSHKPIDFSPLGKKISYISSYNKTLLFPIARKQKRTEIGIDNTLPFYGYDTWNAFELSWLDTHGKPIVALARFDIASDSHNLIESKSFKLYLNSFNNTKFQSKEHVHAVLQKDITEAVLGNVVVFIDDIDKPNTITIKKFDGQCIDHQFISIEQYTVNPAFLSSDHTHCVSETVYSNLLKSNCLVTGQPDWGTVMIAYAGPKIDKIGLLKYIVSFRNHNEFHEQCVERIFMDIMNFCKPTQLTVHARYTRRGGLDINPIRSTEKIAPADNIRMIRQ